MDRYFTSSFEELETDLDEVREIFWCSMKPKPGPFFSLGLLDNLHNQYQLLSQIPLKQTMIGTKFLPFKYVVQGSSIPNVFNYGGDLKLFTDLIISEDRTGLFNYAKLCVDALYLIVTNFSLPIITIALVQGDALGGGFEMALANDVIIAEKKARFGMTEVLFNLFPGMGGYSFLARRLGIKAAEEMIMKGKVFSAEELHEIGIIDVLAENGKGKETVERFVDSNARRYNMRRSVYKIRQRFSQVTHQELLDITTLWVDAALNIKESDLRKMRRLASAQIRKYNSIAPPSSPEIDHTLSLRFPSLQRHLS